MTYETQSPKSRSGQIIIFRFCQWCENRCGARAANSRQGLDRSYSHVIGRIRLRQLLQHRHAFDVAPTSDGARGIITDPVIGILQRDQQTRQSARALYFPKRPRSRSALSDCAVFQRRGQYWDPSFIIEEGYVLEGSSSYIFMLVL